MSDQPSNLNPPLLKPKYIPWVILGGSIVVAVCNELMDPGHWDRIKVGRLVIAVTAIVTGAVSPGLRR